jgi:phosphoribosylglycinamide formyltransferase-1
MQQANGSVAVRTPLKIAVFASGSGSNFQAIVDEVKAGRLKVEVALLVSDRPSAPVVERAVVAGIPVYTFRAKEYASREEYERDILRELELRGVELVVLAGYMRILTDVMVAAFKGRMINIHPSLLPAFAGIHAVKQALDHGVKVAGVTVHYVDGGLDTGPIIAQQAVEVLSDDTEQSLSERIHVVEHVLYPQVISWISEGRVELDPGGKRVIVS